MKCLFGDLILSVVQFINNLYFDLIGTENSEAVIRIYAIFSN